MRSLHFLGILLSLQAWSFTVRTVDGFEFGDYFFTLFPQDRDPSTMDSGDRSDMPVKFYLYKSRKSVGTPRSQEYMVVDKSRMEEAVDAMEHNLPTMFIIHGFMENIRAKVIADTIKATTGSRRWNVVFVDWRELSAGPWYRSALLNVRATGKYVGEFIDSMAKYIDESNEESSNSISDERASSTKRPSEKFFENLHVVGFSLGSHVAGVAGHHLKRGKIGRITALDPANPMIDLLRPGSERIDKSDAKFLDVWHTSTWGIVDPIGHVDFYPNGLSIQPGCETDLIPAGCSHWQAWRFFAASVMFPDAFEAVPCGNWARFQKGHCDKYIKHLKEKGMIRMSAEMRKTARGKFFLVTKPDFPYFMPVKGT